LQSKQDIEAGIEIEVAEVDIPARLKILVNEGERRSCANVWRPIAALSGPRKPVNTFEVQRDKVGHLAKCKFSARTKKDASTKNGAHLGMHAEHEEFGIEGGSGPHS